MLVTFCNAQLVVCTREIYATKVLRPTQSVQQVSNARQGKHIKLCVAVQSPEIDAHSELPCLFANEQNGCPIRANRRTHPALVKQLLYLLLDFGLLYT